MAFIGRLHPLLIHFPIALTIAAAAAEATALHTRDERWRHLAVWNIRAAAAFAVLATMAGWRLALDELGRTTTLEWHRWSGTVAAGVMLASALATSRIDRRPSLIRIYRMALFGAGALVTVAAHLGAVLVWGADFLRP